MIQGILLVASGFILGNKEAQKILNNIVTKGVQSGIDTLNKAPINNVIKPRADKVEKAEE